MPNWLSFGLMALAKVPFEKLLVKKGSRVEALEELEKKLTPDDNRQSLGRPQPTTATKTPQIQRVSTDETVAYQMREIGKEILLLEKHLQQKCKIIGKACDCCEKHPLAIEALAQETLGLTGDPLFNELVVWTRKITPMTTEEASRSGEYDSTYPQLAVEARELRKRMMGTADVKALLSPGLSEKVSEEFREVLDRALGKE